MDTLLDNHTAEIALPLPFNVPDSFLPETIAPRYSWDFGQPTDAYMQPVGQLAPSVQPLDSTVPQNYSIPGVCCRQLCLKAAVDSVAASLWTRAATDLLIL